MLFAGGHAASADTGSLAITAVVPTNSFCRFSAATASLAFGDLNPASTGPAPGGTSIQFWCLGNFGTGTVYVVQAGNGLYPLGPGQRQMRHATLAAERMQYALTLTPTTGTLNWLATQTITINGSIPAAEFQNARPGAYSDTVVIELTP